MDVSVGVHSLKLKRTAVGLFCYNLIYVKLVLVVFVKYLQGKIIFRFCQLRYIIKSIKRIAYND